MPWSHCPSKNVFSDRLNWPYDSPGCLRQTVPHCRERADYSERKIVDLVIVRVLAVYTLLNNKKGERSYPCNLSSYELLPLEFVVAPQGLWPKLLNRVPENTSCAVHTG